MRAEPKANTRGLPTLPALASPLNGIAEIAESGQFRLNEFIHKALRARDDPSDVTTDRDASYFGIVPSERTLVPETAHVSPRPDSPTGSAASRLSSNRRRA
jgi:hypothetical protein